MSVSGYLLECCLLLPDQNASFPNLNEEDKLDYAFFFPDIHSPR